MALIRDESGSLPRSCNFRCNDQPLMNNYNIGKGLISSAYYWLEFLFSTKIYFDSFFRELWVISYNFPPDLGKPKEGVFLVKKRLVNVQTSGLGNKHQMMT